ncbi:hypothetical protein EV363DRAFT_1301159 [Boletus edulis]|nr:hypothetical protein EV363DRAFT_1301159 [Boletus edulis]
MTGEERQRGLPSRLLRVYHSMYLLPQPRTAVFPTTPAKMESVHLVRLEKQRDQVKDAEVSLYGVMRGYFHHLHSIHRERTHGLVALFRYLDDLQEAIAILEELVSTISLSDNRYCAGLPENFTTEFNNWGELRDLEDATNAQGAVVLTPNHHPHGLRGRSSALPKAHNTDGTVVKVVEMAWLWPFRQPRFMRLLALGDIISMFKHAIDLTPQGHPTKHTRPINNLASSMFTRFEESR